MFVGTFGRKDIAILQEVTNTEQSLKKKINQSFMNFPHFCTVSLATFSKAEEGGTDRENGWCFQFDPGQGEVLTRDCTAEEREKAFSHCLGWHLH